MTRRFITLLFVCFSLALVANNGTPVNLEDGKAAISMEIADLEAIEKIILNEGLTYDELALKYPELVANANIASESEEDGIFDKSSDSPLGIPGFWWGFCLGWIGMLVVYLTMDSGSDRKEQIMNALWGCVIGSVVGIILYFAFWAVLFTTV